MKQKGNFLYLTVFISGAAVLILEILGTRIIAPFYGSTIFVWSSLIVVTLGFLSLGYFFGGRLADKNPETKLLYRVILISAFFISLILKIDQPVLIFTDRVGLKYGPLVASLILFAPSFLTLGMITPIAIRLISKNVKKSGRTAGKIFAISTLGSVAGALLAGFFLLPTFSLTQIFITMSIILATVSVVGFFEKRHFSLFVVFLFSVVFVPKIQGKIPNTLEMLYHKQSFFGDIKVVGSRNFRCLFVNGIGQTCMNLNSPQEPKVLFVKQTADLMQALPGGSKTLLLGLAGGAIVNVVPRNIDMDIVELDPVMREIAQDYFEVSLEEKNLFIDDARRFLRKSPSNVYDLVLVDTSLGANLPYYMYSSESFFEMKRVVKDGGLVVLHTEVSSDTNEDLFVASILKTAGLFFENVELYSSHPVLFSNSIIYLYGENSPIANVSNRYHKFEMEERNEVMVSDNFNPLEEYYLSHALMHVQNSKISDKQLLFVE